MLWMPFLCLAAGFFIASSNKLKKVIEKINVIIDLALITLMVIIGLNIGIDESVMTNLDSIGFNCFAISMSAISASIIFILIIEKTILPLEKLREKIISENNIINSEIDISREEKSEKSQLIWLIPASIVFGVIFGYVFKSNIKNIILDYLLIGSLIILYFSVGISLGVNRKVYKFIKIVGFRVFYIPLAIFLGSLLGGFVAGNILGIPLNKSVIAASGMGYYSITGAYMTQAYGIEAGTYGFLVNVMRDFFTVLLMPILIKISTGSPIAAGASGNMDTMLVPVTKFVGSELGLVTLITGVILTVAVPIILPILYSLL